MRMNARANTCAQQRHGEVNAEASEEAAIIGERGRAAFLGLSPVKDVNVTELMFFNRHTFCDPDY